MPNLYSCEIPLTATFYVAADSPEAAAEIAAARAGTAIHATEGDVNIDDSPFDICADTTGYEGFSPAMTVDTMFSVSASDMEISHVGTRYGK